MPLSELLEEDTGTQDGSWGEWKIGKLDPTLDRDQAVLYLWDRLKKDLAQNDPLVLQFGNFWDFNDLVLERRY